MIWPISFKSHFCGFLTKLSNCFGSYVRACCTIDLKISHNTYPVHPLHKNRKFFNILEKNNLFIFSYVESKCKISYIGNMLILHCFQDWNQLIRLDTPRQIPTRPVLNKIIQNNCFSY